MRIKIQEIDLENQNLVDKNEILFTKLKNAEKKCNEIDQKNLIESKERKKIEKRSE